MSKAASRLKQKVQNNTSRLDPPQVSFLQALGKWLQANGYRDRLAEGLEVQVENRASNCSRWCYDDDEDPWCCRP